VSTAPDDRPRRPVRASAVLSEAWRDVVTGASRVLTTAVVLALVALTCVCADLFVVARLLAGAQDYQSSGAATYLLSAPGRVAADACDALGEVDGVVDAGALRRAGSGLTPVRMPATNLPVYEATPGLVAAITGSTARTGAGVLLSGTVAESLGLGAGDEVVTATGSVPVSGTYVYPDDGRRAGLGYAVLAPVPASGLMDECRVTVWPSSPERVRLLWGTLRDGSDPEGDEPRLLQLSTRHGTAFTGGAEHDARISRFAPLVAGAAALAVGFVTVRRRRLELAGALHLGCGRSALLGQMLLEAVAPTLVAAALTTAGTVWLLVSPLGEVEPGALLRSAAGVVALTACGHLLGVAAATGITRERHLFHYFRHR
jgi:hypothetical protein